MKPHSPTNVTTAESAPEDIGAENLLIWLPHLAKAQEIKDEPASFASPPCFLAQFSNAEFTDEIAK